MNGVRKRSRERMAIYYLYADGQLWPFYVGITNNPERRLKEHRASASSQLYEAGKRIADIGAENVRMEVVAWADGRFNARLIERALIGELVAQRIELANMEDTEAGYLPPPLT